MKTMTVKQLDKAIKSNKYILARFYTDNDLIGLNCMIQNTKAYKVALAGRCSKQKTNYISFIPCSFMEYISHKTPFL